MPVAPAQRRGEHANATDDALCAPLQGKHRAVCADRLRVPGHNRRALEPANSGNGQIAGHTARSSPACRRFGYARRDSQCVLHDQPACTRIQARAPARLPRGYLWNTLPLQSFGRAAARSGRRRHHNPNFLRGQGPTVCFGLVHVRAPGPSHLSHSQARKSLRTLPPPRALQPARSPHKVPMQPKSPAPHASPGHVRCLEPPIGSIRYAAATARRSRLSGGGRCRDTGRRMLVRFASDPAGGARGCAGHGRRIVPTAVCGRPLRRTLSPCHIDTSPEKRCSASGGGFWRDGGRAIACLLHTDASGTASPGDTGRADWTRRCGGLLGRSDCS